MTTPSSPYRTVDRGPRHQPGSSQRDLGQRYVVDGSRGHYLVTDLANGKQVGPAYLHHADALQAASRLNHPAGKKRGTTQQGNLFDSTQEA